MRVGPTGHQFWSLLTPWNHRPLRFHPYVPQRTLTRTLTPILTLSLMSTPANPISPLHLPRYVPLFAVHGYVEASWAVGGSAPDAIGAG